MVKQAWEPAAGTSSHPRMTSPMPTVNSNGLLSSEESNTVPSTASDPVSAARQQPTSVSYKILRQEKTSHRQ